MKLVVAPIFSDKNLFSRDSQNDSNKIMISQKMS